MIRGHYPLVVIKQLQVSAHDQIITLCILGACPWGYHKISKHKFVFINYVHRHVILNKVRDQFSLRLKQTKFAAEAI